MKPLRSFLDKLEPLFKKGGKLEKLYPLFEAGDTLFYSPGDVTSKAPHVRDGIDFKRLMTMVIVALLPCIFMAMYNTGLQANLAMVKLGVPTWPALSGWGFFEPNAWRGAIFSLLNYKYDPNCITGNLFFGALYFVPIYIVCLAAGGVWEVLFAVIRKHEVNEGFFVTAFLLPLSLPATIPLWQVVIGTSFGVVIGKEIFGGTGRNFLNPALTARAFLFFAYPSGISGDAVWTAVDGFSGATALGIGAVEGMPGITAVMTWTDAFLGTIQGSMGETSTLACIIGAIFLSITGIASWRVMISMLAGAVALSGLFFFIGSSTNPMFGMPPHWHIVLGGFAFGLVFMATDPVSSAVTTTGQYIYGFLIGAMVVLVRVVNPAFPEGTMLAILFGNTFAPLIDYYVVKVNTKRRALRHV